MFLIASAIGCSDPQVGLQDASPDAEPIDAALIDSGVMLEKDGGADTDAEIDGGVDAGELEDAGGIDANIPCEDPPNAPVSIDRSITICGGEVSIGLDPTTRAAIRVTASDVSITCLGTRFAGTEGFGSTAEPTIGFLLEGVARVRISGCGARGFRYGLVARDSTELAIENADFSDNFTDPNADWVQDTVQGGGIRFDGTTASVVENSSFARNWNGIELRDSSDNVVTGNVADHCSNTGATLVNAHRNRLERNDFSWGIRGAGLSFPNSWYGIDTKDSAGIIIDALSSENVISENDTRYGGDGIFIRSVIGGCAPNNIIERNDTSFSPHNAIECWCDGNQFIENIASDSHYGIWLGGTDYGVVRGNVVERNVVDGISIQIGEDRHTVIERNIVTDNGRTGILLTGREVQAWDPLDRVGPNLANSSHILVQRNELANNGPCPPFDRCDVFVASSRGVLLASNCGDGMTTVEATPGFEAFGLWSVGACGADPQNRPPIAALADVSAVAGVMVTLDASGSTDPENAPLGFHWLVQRAGVRFVPAAMPEAILSGPGGAQAQLTFPSSGLWDVSVFVDDGSIAAGAQTTVAVVPQGLELGTAAADWSWRCTDPACVTSITDDTNAKVSGPSSVHVATNEPFDFAAFTPPGRQASWNFSGFTRIAAFFLAQNRNPYGWQGNFPTFVLGSAAGTITLTPNANLLPLEANEWIYVDVPLAGGDGWTRVDSGAPDLSDIDFVEIHTDTWDFGTYHLWIDALIAH